MEKVVEALSTLARTMGLVAAELWPHAVRAYWVGALASAVILPVSAAVLGVVAWRVLCSAIREQEAYQRDKDRYGGCPVAQVKFWVGGVAAVACVGLSLASLLLSEWMVAALVDPAGRMTLDIMRGWKP